MAAVTVCSDFGAQENKVSHCFLCFPIFVCHEVMGPDAMILVFRSIGRAYLKQKKVIKAFLRSFYRQRPFQCSRPAHPHRLVQINLPPAPGFDSMKGRRPHFHPLHRQPPNLTGGLPGTWGSLRAKAPTLRDPRGQDKGMRTSRKAMLSAGSPGGTESRACRGLPHCHP